MEKEDTLTLLAGLYHCFILDEKNYVLIFWLFTGEPVWTILMLKERT